MSPASPSTPADVPDLSTLPANQRTPDPGPADPLTLALSQDAAAVPPALGQRLQRRVAAHREANAAMHTLRQPLRTAPEPWAGGLRAWPLSPGRSWWVELPPHATLPRLDTTHELLVLDGALRLGDATLPAHGHAVAAGATAGQAGPQGARLYLRLHRDGPFSPPPAPLLHRPHEDAWQPLRPGVAVRPLHGEGGAMSLVARFEPGARVPAHPHGIDEECLMLEGDLFLGDLLLRQGGFQAAPAGSQHGDLVADGPCLLFFHGAIDPAAVDNAHRQTLGHPPL